MMPAESGPSTPSNSQAARRDFFIALVCGIAVLAFVIYGIYSMGSKQREASRVTLTGKVISKSFKPAPEEQISFGKKGLKSEHIAGEYLLRVRVDAENRTFEVPVAEPTFDSVKVGDRFTFARPRSEQK
jgi:hypothetical protein